MCNSGPGGSNAWCGLCRVSLVRCCLTRTTVELVQRLKVLAVAAVAGVEAALEEVVLEGVSPHLLDLLHDVVHDLGRQHEVDLKEHLHTAAGCRRTLWGTPWERGDARRRGAAQ